MLLLSTDEKLIVKAWGKSSSHCAAKYMKRNCCDFKLKFNFVAVNFPVFSYSIIKRKQYYMYVIGLCLTCVTWETCFSYN